MRPPGNGGKPCSTVQEDSWHTLGGRLLASSEYMVNPRVFYVHYITLALSISLPSANGLATTIFGR